MRCPTLAELPSPPPGKTGWPWTEESPRLPPIQPDGRPWPRVSIVTPSYNQGRFIEETIRSVLLQGYPDLEFIIMDGGSTDETVSIITKYEQWITHWESAKDGGQSAAINKGMARATGEWANWINSDDMLELGGLRAVGEVCARACYDTKAIAFNCLNIEEDGGRRHVSRKCISKSVWQFLTDRAATPQPSTFVRAENLRVDEGLHFVMDWALHFTLVERFPNAFAESEEVVAIARNHAATKTALNFHRFRSEGIEFLRGYRSSTLETDAAILVFGVRHRAQTRFKAREPTIYWCLRSLMVNPILAFDRFYLGAFRRALNVRGGKD